MKDRDRSGKFLLAIIMILEWLALPVQFYLLVKGTDYTWAESLVRFFSFFTVLTNSLVAICCTILVLSKKTRLHRFFNNYSTITAITVYILIVGIVYNVILRRLHHLAGLHRTTSEIFHTVVPILFFLFWLLFAPKRYINWKNLFSWQVYPLLYVVYTLIHGLYTKFYPYPFIDVNKLGFAKAITNGAFVLLAFVILSIVLIATRQSYAKA